MNQRKITEYIDIGSGNTILLLHGLFGALSNWKSTIDKFAHKYRVIVPVLPINNMPIRESNLETLIGMLDQFIIEKELKNISIVGNSLGGHLAIMYTLKHPKLIEKMVLTASSGLFEDSMGGSFPKRGNYDYIAERVRYTFFDPNIVDKSYIDEVFEITSNATKALRVVGIAKSAQRNNLAKDIPSISTKTLLIWGLNDTITPAHVGIEFSRLLPNSTLKFINNCCHAPMMEDPNRFNALLAEFMESKH
jgi:pimeloyl-ACP methyl ester carboxylesterase